MKCFECTRKATMAVLVPWIQVKTLVKGDDWEPYCVAHAPIDIRLPAAENWDTIDLTEKPSSFRLPLSR